MPKHSLKTSRSSCLSAIQHVIDEIYKKLKDQQIEFIYDIFEQPWGQRVVRVYDPDKYIIELGEPMNVVIKRHYEAGMTLEEVAGRSSTPISIVKNVINSLVEKSF
ncbi:hypothetical protein A3848_25920 [Paenibacillus sp. P32E]|nr:hypothetical protein A3848_25920 [Paenibacillus sp. P32E]